MRGNLRSHRGHVNDRVMCMPPSSRAGHGTECSVTLFIVDKVYGLEGHCFTLDGVLPSTQSRRRKRDRREGLITGPSQTLLCARTTATASSSQVCVQGNGSKERAAIQWLKKKKPGVPSAQSRPLRSAVGPELSRVPRSSAGSKGHHVDHGISHVFYGVASCMGCCRLVPHQTQP